MTTTGDALAAKFEQANAELIRVVEGMDDARWTRKADDTGWPAGVAAHHVAEGIAPLTEWVKAVASGTPATGPAPDQLDQMNAEHAERASGCTREETLALLRRDGAGAAEMLRSLGPDQLAQKSFVTFAGSELTAEQITEMILIGHIGMHLPGIRGS